MDSVVVTGASSGIGLATARVLVERGFKRVFGTVRREADARRLAQELGAAFTPLVCDVTDEGSVAGAAAQVRSALGGRTLAGLVNNAGIVVPGPVLSQSRADFEAQIQVNLVGTFVATRAFLPLLGAERGREGRPGRIVNVSSVGGKIAGPFIAAYAASKHAIEGFSESLRRELMLFEIPVIIVGPGSTATPIWEKGEAAGQGLDDPEYAGAIRAFTRYSQALAREGYPPERVGEAIAEALTTARPKLRYAVVPGRLVNWTLPRLLPRRVVDRAIAGTMRLLPEHRPASDSGRVALVTGATSGIGLAIAEGLARHGDTVLVVGRDEARARAACEAIALRTGNPRAVPLAADLSEMADVGRLAEAVARRFPRLDVLINNASAIFSRRERTREGLERTFAVNHLAGFHLTTRLSPTLPAGGRIVNVSADPSMLARIEFPADDLQSERGYRGITAYMATKLMNVLFTYELARRLAGRSVAVNAMHPGVVRTGLDRDLRGPLKWLLTLARPLLRTPERAARTALMLAIAPETAGVSGRFFVDERERRSSPVTYDEALARRLWAESERLVQAAVER